MAIRNLWGKPPLPTTNQVHQVTPGISILKDETKTQPKIETRLPQPSPYHTWVVRGKGGSWRAKKNAQKDKEENGTSLISTV